MQQDLTQVPLTKKVVVNNFLKKPDYHFISAKAKIKFDSEFGSGKANLYLRTIKDSLIWLAAKKISVEVGRVLITTDSIFIINRVEKNYQKFSLSEVKERYGLPASMPYIQNMLLGITPPLDTTQHWQVLKDSSAFRINAVCQDIFHKFLIDQYSGKVTAGSFHDKFSSDGIWNYDRYEYLLGNIDIPRHRSYTITNGKGQEISMEANFTEWEVDNPKTINFTIPKHYQRIY